MDNVLYSPKASDPLLSLQALANKGHTIILRKDGGEIVRGNIEVSHEAEHLTLDRPNNTFWVLKDQSTKPPKSLTTGATTSTLVPPTSSKAKGKGKLDLPTLHRKMGHAGSSRLKELVKGEMSTD